MRRPLLALALLPAAAGAQDAYRAPERWKQGVEYRVEARLDESTDVLHGKARLRYRNDSPHTQDAFWFHLYLNAFRPNSAWARRDLEFGITTFQELGPEEHGFERIRELTVDGRAVLLRYPFAPDSTIMGFDLPEPLEPGESLTVDYTWDARPSVVPRRQGRRGRQYDFAQWYPRVVVYDDEGWRIHPLYRSGEFYGEFALYDVTLEVRSDQVIGATGVPVSGDPGWEAAAAPGTETIDYQREWYGSLEGPPCVERAGVRVCGVTPATTLRAEEPLGHLAAEAPAGWKRVRWYAEDVHHFAWSTSPDYVFEQGRWEDVAIRVLYQPGDESTWGGGIAALRTAIALQWLASVFGDYPYPQVTNLHRIEGGGTEFPMVVMDGSASQGLILHEVGHIYAHGILANNEWYEGWLDEGMSSFQTSWFFERAGQGAAAWEGSILSTLLLDLQGVSEPVVLPAEKYSEHAVYSQMIYTKGEVVLWMLREMAGEEAFTRILRTYYDRYRFRHVDSDAFQEVAEEVLRADLDGFFGQWLHGTGVVDYALDDVRVARHPRGGYEVTIEVEREGDLVMPVPVRLVAADGAAKDTVVDGWALEAEHSIRADFAPRRVELDPDGTILDWNVRNNGWKPGLLGNPAPHVRVGNPLAAVPLEWRRIPVRLFPLGWWNDIGGAVVGLQVRSAQLGTIHRSLLRVGLPAVGGDPWATATADAADERDGDAGFDPGSVYMRLENPVGGGRPLLGTTLEAFLGEGRGFLGWRREREERDPPLTGSASAARAFASLHWVHDPDYLVEGQWTPERKLGVEAGVGLGGEVGAARRVRLDGALAAGFDSRERRWVRATVTARGAAGDEDGFRLRGRLFGGAALGPDPGEGSAWEGDFVPRERMFFLSGGGPFASSSNPWVRSRGAPLADEGWVPGGGELRGFHPGVPLPALATLTAEALAPPLTFTARGRWVVSPVVFAGAGVGADLPVDFHPTALDDPTALDPRVYWSVGAGVEVGLRGSPIRVKLDVPFLLSHPELAGTGRDEKADLRWTIGVVGY